MKKLDKILIKSMYLIFSTIGLWLILLCIIGDKMPNSKLDVDEALDEMLFIIPIILMCLRGFFK